MLIFPTQVVLYNTHYNIFSSFLPPLMSVNICANWWWNINHISYSCFFNECAGPYFSSELESWIMAVTGGIYPNLPQYSPHILLRSSALTHLLYLSLLFSHPHLLSISLPFTTNITTSEFIPRAIRHPDEKHGEWEQNFMPVLLSGADSDFRITLHEERFLRVHKFVLKVLKEKKK